jgi:nucleoside-diphosphate-sugar epimerase
MKLLITGGSGFIGTNLIEKLISDNKDVILNLDNFTPKNVKHLSYWKKCDIMDEKQVNEIFMEFQPDAVIHLAARTDTDPVNTISDYDVNIKGSKNILTAIRSFPSVKRAIITSTQFVNQYQGLPKSDQDFAPHTVYGESKVEMENMTRNAGLNCIWTIIRPTNIWGPWHIRYPYEFWKVLSKGLYFHPGRKPVIRSYGYVGNVVFQIISILECPSEKVNQKVFYVGDLPIDIYNWVNGFSLRQIGRKVRVVPRIIVRSLALTGDILSLFKIKFPLTSSRYKSMTNSNITPLDKTFDAFGTPPYTLEQGIEETVAWMRVYHPDLVKIQ